MFIVHRNRFTCFYKNKYPAIRKVAGYLFREILDAMETLFRHIYLHLSKEYLHCSAG